MSDADTLASLTVLTHSTYGAYKAQKAIVLDLRDQLSSATDLQDLTDKYTSAERKLIIAENDAMNRALRELDEETRIVLENIRLRREAIYKTSIAIRAPK